jgi:hypothetical protein
MRHPRRRGLRIALITLVVLIAAAGFIVWYELLRTVPARYESIEEHFKYGAIGNERHEGMPYWIWVVLPRIFPEYLPGPGGYASLGIAWEQGHEWPVGFSKTTVGFPRLAINCAFCHTATVRTSPRDAVPQIILGGPSHQFDPQSYIRFLNDCAADPRFNADVILGELDNVYRLSRIQKLLYRYVIIPQTRRALLRQREEFAWMDSRPRWGHGRIDPFNPIKFRILGQPLDDTVGNADMVPLWNLRAREGMSLHWDGLNASLHEVVLSSAIGDGATRRTVDLAGLERIEDWLRDLPPPPYPYPVDQELARKGSAIYAGVCASCHAFDGDRTGTVIPLEEIGSSGYRLAMWTAGSADAYNAFARGYPWQFTGFQKTNGYVAVPLDGLWLRAPYLHNGSVPTLADLLEAPEARPRLFHRGYDVYDPERVGFVSFGPEAAGAGSEFDVREPGNGNEGHLWGTDLSPDEKRALLEYLKTL